MEEEIITPEEEVFAYNKLRYILDKDGYVCHASLGGLIICDLGSCTEYTGEVPDGYISIEEWYDEEIDKLNAWKIVDNKLVFDENRYKELQTLYEIQAEENSCSTHKWVRDKLRVSTSVVTDELSGGAIGTSLIVLSDAGNYVIPELKIESVSVSSVNVISSNKNILGIEGVTSSINGVDITVNADGTIKLNGTATDNIEYDLNGSNTNQEMLYLIKNNTNYAISGLTDNVSLSLYSYDGTDRALVGTHSNGNINITDTYKITQTVLNIPSGSAFKDVVISPQIEIGGATPFIKHEETKAIGILEDNECIIDTLMSYTDKTIIMIDEEVSSSVKYYRYQYLTEKFAEIEINENEVKSTVAEMTETIDQQNTAISQISQTVNEIKSEISDIADITTSADGYGNVSLGSITESEPIYIKIYPSNNEDISYLYPHDNLFPSDTLFLKGRTLRFQNDDYYIDYELPNDLLYYDENNYDEFVLDYDTQTCQINKRVGYNADGTKCLLETPKTTSYEYPSIPLIAGDYTVTMLDYNNAYMFIRMMCENIYTNQFATKVELNSSIIQTKESITSQVSKEYATKNELVTTQSSIKQTTDSINLEVAKKVNNTDYTSAQILMKINNDTSSTVIKSDKLDVNAIATFTNNKLANAGSTVINGSNITTGTISAKRLDSKVITTDNFSAQNINASNITGGSFRGPSAYFGDQYGGGILSYYNGIGYLACGINGFIHPYVSALNVSGYNGISLRDGQQIGSTGNNKGRVHLDSYNNLSVVADTNDLYLQGYHVLLQAREGNIYASRDSGTNYKVSTENGNISSLKLKDNLQKFESNDYEQAYDLLRKIDFYRFDYKYKISDNKNEYGFIIDYIEENKDYDKFLHFKDEKAKVVNDELDYLVSENDENVIDFKKYDQENLSKYMFSLLKSMQIKIDNLEQEIKILKGSEK